MRTKLLLFRSGTVKFKGEILKGASSLCHKIRGSSVSYLFGALLTNQAELNVLGAIKYSAQSLH